MWSIRYTRHVSAAPFESKNFEGVRSLATVQTPVELANDETDETKEMEFPHLPLSLSLVHDPSTAVLIPFSTPHISTYIRYIYIFSRCVRLQLKRPSHVLASIIDQLRSNSS